MVAAQVMVAALVGVLCPFRPILANGADPKGTGIAVAQLDLRQVEDVRERMPIEGVSWS